MYDSACSHFLRRGTAKITWKGGGYAKELRQLVMGVAWVREEAGERIEDRGRALMGQEEGIRNGE